jgi:hypothetical protein
MARKRKQKNPHAELCAWANGLRPDSPQHETTEDEALADDADREMFGDDFDVLRDAGYGEIGNK